MHLIRTEFRSIDDDAPAVDLDQTPADVVFLSFTDSDLAAMAAAWDASPGAPSLRLASLALLKRPYSVDLYVDKVARRARFVLVRLLGGVDYWRYGVDELAAAARAHGFQLALVPGDYREDPRLDEASTLDAADLRALWAYFQAGGPDNMAACLLFIQLRMPSQDRRHSPPPPPVAVAAFGEYVAARRPEQTAASRALIVFYRSAYLAADCAPIVALADALAAKGLDVTAVYVSSLKDPQAAEPLRALIATLKPDVILNTTAFSARGDDGAGVLDAADAPVLQAILAGAEQRAWAASTRGLGAPDLAMNVVLPEIDGRIVAGVLSFKEEAERRDALQYTRLAHAPAPMRVDHVARLAANWARLRATPPGERRMACILSDYPAKGGRRGYAVGLDTPDSVRAIARALRDAGYAIDPMPEGDALMRALGGDGAATIALAEYERRLAELPRDFVASVIAAWGDPADDPAFADGAFHFAFVRAGAMIVALQPDRGRAATRKATYHDPALAPRHAYIAFYLWLREIERVHAIVHCGAHGTLEWLPGKSVALSEACAPEVVLGALPVIYPFIVNNPGEASVAKRRIAAVTIGHLTPPLGPAGAHGEAAEIEGLLDEYSEAAPLDPRRAGMLADMIIERAVSNGLMEESGAAKGADRAAQLTQLDAWLCDIKDMRIGDGLHVFGGAFDAARRAMMIGDISAAGGGDAAMIGAALDRSALSEMDGLLRALDGRFVEPGPAGAPSRGRIDVLPTGRNLFTIDPRAVPTRTAWEIGRRTAEEIVARYAQDRGEWPRSIVIDLWGSASMRTGGDDLAQAFALIGVKPRWDHGSSRVGGFDILSLAALGRSRVDVTLRISGLFRDVFPAQIALFDAAARVVALLDEEPEDNPLVASRTPRVFGAAPGQYGVGLSGTLARGDWSTKEELGEIYLDATSHAYGAEGEGVEAAATFRARVAGADAFVHVQDMAGQDVLDSDAFAEHEGGFAAAAKALGASPAIYHADATRGDRTVVRTLPQEIARALRGRAINPRWLAGQMRHGNRGAAEIAETIDNLFAYAATTDAVPSRHFDLMFDATCGDENVRAFLIGANPDAARAIADRFDEAMRRGLWASRRNSTMATLDEMRRSA
jgi:cobaltochelatase CobN